MAGMALFRTVTPQSPDVAMGVRTVFRSVVVGLVGACLYFVVNLPEREAGSSSERQELEVLRREVVMQRARAEVYSQVARSMDVVDVAASVPATSVPGLVRVSASEHIVAVDDHPVASDLVAGGLIIERAHRGGYVDLTIEERDGSGLGRRVLVVMH